MCKSISAVIINIQFQLVIDYNIFKLKYRLHHWISHVMFMGFFIQLKNAPGGISAKYSPVIILK